MTGTPTRVTLNAWGDDDLPVLERSNTPEMTAFLGGPESVDQLVVRHERYLRLNASGEAHTFRIDVDGAPVGSIGYWQTDHEGVPAWETGWSVEPGWQGRGIARDALRLLLRRVAAERTRTLLVAYPGAENAASNALCRSTGFQRRGGGTMPWRGGELTFSTWVLDLAPLDLDGMAPDLDERFDGGVLDETVWWPWYLPHWSSRERTGARYTVGPDGLELRIDESTPTWSPEYDGDVRVSHLQTGQLSGPVGSTRGQHRFRDGLVVREAQPERRLLLRRFGVIEVRMAAVRHPDAMVACWPIGFEDEPDQSGEICIAEIFGSDIGDDGGWVGVGVKPQHDPRLQLDFEKVWVAGDLTEMHDYAALWSPDGIRFFIDHRWVKTVPQRIDYPVQLMLDLYELPNAAGVRDVGALPHRFRVERVRTFPPA